MRIPSTLARAAFAALEMGGKIVDKVKSEASRCVLAIDPANSWTVRGEETYNSWMSAVRRFGDGLQSDSKFISAYFAQFPEILGHPEARTLLEIITGSTALDENGFPQIPLSSFEKFRDHVTHLFQNGLELLRWFDLVEETLQNNKGLNEATMESIRRGISALRTMVKTASITSPADLWTLRQIVATHQKMGILKHLQELPEIVVEDFAKKHQLDEKQLASDLQFLHARGYLDRTEKGFTRNAANFWFLTRLIPLGDEFRIDMTQELLSWFQGDKDLYRSDLIRRWLELPGPCARSSRWIANEREIEIGYRTLPLILALHASGTVKDLNVGDYFPPGLLTKEMLVLLEEAGVIHEFQLTELGYHMLKRGVGNFGIIGAYHSYLNQHEGLLRSSGERPWVERGKNIAASRDANRKTFQGGVRSLKRFCEDTGFEPQVVIEHALGLGVAIQEFVNEFGEKDILFVGLDYEKTSLLNARLEQSEGRLPERMQFVRADIRNPLPVQTGKGTVVFVGNGFHEARRVSDDDMVEVFSKYERNQNVLIFTEESGLSDSQILRAAWNTSHAAFRYFHQLSGQGLRSPWPNPEFGKLSWSECVQKAGYQIIKKYTYQTRPILPCHLPESENPAVSVTFFCVPQDFNQNLGLRQDGK